MLSADKVTAEAQVRRSCKHTAKKRRLKGRNVLSGLCWSVVMKNYNDGNVLQVQNSGRRRWDECRVVLEIAESVGGSETYLRIEMDHGRI